MSKTTRRSAVTKLALEAIGGYEVLSCSSGAQALEEVVCARLHPAERDDARHGRPADAAQLRERIDWSGFR